MSDIYATFRLYLFLIITVADNRISILQAITKNQVILEHI